MTFWFLQAFTQPQAEVLYHVIAQPNSRDAVHSMLGMSRQVSHTALRAENCSHWGIVLTQQMQPCLMVEEALVRLALVAMEMVESVEGGGEEGEQRVREVWSQLANKLVFFYFLQLINITSVINQLRARVRGFPCEGLQLHVPCDMLPAPIFRTMPDSALDYALNLAGISNSSLPAAGVQPVPQRPGLAHVVSTALCDQYCAEQTSSTATG